MLMVDRRLRSAVSVKKNAPAQDPLCSRFFLCATDAPLLRQDKVRSEFLRNFKACHENRGFLVLALPFSLSACLMAAGTVAYCLTYRARCFAHFFILFEKRSSSFL
jgi:hypothetical protein